MSDPELSEDATPEEREQFYDEEIAPRLLEIAQVCKANNMPMLWWRPDGKGYTADLDRAGKYTLEDARRRTGRDQPMPVYVIDAVADRRVPTSRIDRG